MDGAVATPGSSRRIELVDAVRGLALAGILQVNIQSFTWGSGDVLGYLDDPPGAIESALYFLQSAFFEGKFYPIFAFLFGLGLSLQLRALRRRLGGNLLAARARLGRRLAFLFALGVLHGVLLYFGDVLAAYAVCAWLFLQLAPQRPRRLLRLAQACVLGAALSLFTPVILDRWLASGPNAPTPIEVEDGIVIAHEIYSQEGYGEQWAQRIDDEVWQQLGSIPDFWPQVLALMALGALAGRQGWLRHPRRHAALWRGARRLGWALGLPFALLGAALQMDAARSGIGESSAWGDVAAATGSLMAAAYLAHAVAWLQGERAAAARRWLAGVGRLSLTNYLLQSLVMGALLCGWGLGWGADATRMQLMLLALLIFAVQGVASNLWLRYRRQGPVEALWRRWTYRGLAAADAGAPSRPVSD